MDHLTGTADAPPAANPSAVGAAPPFSELTARRLGPIRRYFVRHPVAMDVAVMMFVALWVLVGNVSTGPEGEPPTAPDAPTAVGVAISVAMIAVLFWRRRRPVLTYGIVVGLFVLVVALTGSTFALDIGLTLVIYAVAVSYPAWAGWTALVVAAGSGALAIWAWAAPTFVDEPMDIDERATSIVGLLLTGLIAMTIGFNVRNRRLHVAELVERANAIARDRDQQAQIARAAERSRIAREMHDVVAHSLSVMIALADGAGAALERSPDNARHALAELSTTGRSALTDMRRVLGVLDPDAPLEPPGSPDLAELVERFRTAGLSVHTEGLSTEFADTGLALAVYRIIQEALTNTLRYAPGTPSVDVTIARTEDRVEVRVVDHGARLPVGSSGGAGRGLIGMSERVAVYGGTVDAGPWTDGWRIRAVLPWKDAET